MRNCLAVLILCLFSLPNASAFQSNTNEICGLAAQVNARNLSFWHPDLQKKFRDDMLKMGNTSAMVSAYLVYLRMDMQEKCPRIW
jgi:hypothetical protein